jgi:hypothetical protein
MAMTFRQLLNSVLIDIGSATIPTSNTTITDTYQLQVAGFLNKIKEEVEDAWNWRALWVTYTFVYQPAVLSQPIIDMNTGATPNERCRTVRMTDKRVGREVALCFDITSFGIPFPMAEAPKAGLLYFNTVFNQVPVQYSTTFAVDNTGGSGVSLLVYPGANQARTVQITLCNPVPRIDPTVAGSTGGLDTIISIPTQPIEYGTIWYALQERGEELGTSTIFTEERYRTALDDAIARDSEESGGITMTVA